MGEFCLLLELHREGSAPVSGGTTDHRQKINSDHWINDTSLIILHH